MRLKFPKIVALLILLAFLATSTAGNVFGCTVCAVGESSQRVNTSGDKGCCTDCCTDDRMNDHDDSYEVPAIHQPSDEQHGSCLNCFTQRDSEVLSKRIKRIPATAIAAITSNVFPLNSAASVKRVVGILAPQPPTKTSQTILAHRTVVLLN